MEAVIIGYGEIGKAIGELMDEAGVKFAIEDINTKYSGTAKFMHVCIPFSEEFVNIVDKYVDKFSPDAVIVHSTVYPGTTAKIKAPSVHSPVNGRHPKMVEGLKTYTKFVGYDKEETFRDVAAHLRKMFNVRPVNGSHKTELMKILCLARYGLYLRIADKMDDICGDFGCEYSQIVTEWDKEYNKGMAKINPNWVRPLYTPPKGSIGGHCVLPVSRFFNERYYQEDIFALLQEYEGMEVHKHIPNSKDRS